MLCVLIEIVPLEVLISLEPFQFLQPNLSLRSFLAKILLVVFSLSVKRSAFPTDCVSAFGSSLLEFLLSYSRFSLYSSKLVLCELCVLLPGLGWGSGGGLLFSSSLKVAVFQE